MSFYTLDGFIVANLPIKELPKLKEGAPSSNGSGVIGIVKNPPHPNATKVFVNWLLGKQGQELYAKAMHQSTRRLDVDTKWLQEHGVKAAKDVMTPRRISPDEEPSGRQVHAGENPFSQICRADPSLGATGQPPCVIHSASRRALPLYSFRLHNVSGCTGLRRRILLTCRLV